MKAQTFYDVSEDDRDHEFGCDSDNNTFEAKAINEASIDISTSRFKSEVDDDNNNIVANIDKNFVKLDIDCLNKNKLKIYNPPTN